MKRSIVFLIALVFVLPIITFSQPNLVLTKRGKPKHFFYQVGDKISYHDKATDRKISGVIISLTDSTLELARAPKISVSNIDKVYRVRHFFAQAAGAGVVVLGIYFPISVINSAFQGYRPIIDEDMMIVNGTMLAVSGVSWLFLVRRIEVGPKWKLEVLDFGRPVYD